MVLTAPRTRPTPDRDGERSGCRHEGPLAALVGADLQVPLVTGGTVRYANLDLAASAPALVAVADRVAQ